MSNNESHTTLRNILTLSVEGFGLLSPSGKRTLIVYSTSLALIGLLDALGVGFLAYAVSSTSTLSLEINDDFLLIFFASIFLFLSRSILATWISYSGLKSMAKEEVAIGQTSFDIRLPKSTYCYNIHSSLRYPQIFNFNIRSREKKSRDKDTDIQ